MAGLHRLDLRLGGLRRPGLDRMDLFPRGLDLRVGDRVGVGTTPVDPALGVARGLGGAHAAIHRRYPVSSIRSTARTRSI